MIGLHDLSCAARIGRTGLLCWLALASVALWASEEPAGIHLSPAASAVEQGEALQVVVESWWPEDWRVAEEADPLLAFAEVYVRQWQEDPAWRDGNTLRQRWTLHIEAEESGPWPLPRISMYWYDAAGNLQERRSDPVVIMVDMPAPELDFGEGLGLWRPQLVAMSWWWYGLILVVIAGVALLILVRWRRQRPLTPEQRLHQALQAVAQETQASQAMGLLAQALRGFAADRWQIPLRGASVREVQRHLGQHPDPMLQELASMLCDIDRDRWTPQGASQAQQQAMLNRAQQWLQRLTSQERSS